MDFKGPNLLISNPLTSHGILNPSLHTLHVSHVSPPLSSSAPQALLLSLFLTATQVHHSNFSLLRCPLYFSISTKSESI